MPIDEELKFFRDHYARQAKMYERRANLTLIGIGVLVVILILLIIV